MSGVSTRIARIIRPSTKRTVIIPLDLGAGFGVMPGLSSLARVIAAAKEAGADAVLGHRGLIRAYEGVGEPMGLIGHLSVASTLAPDPNWKVLVNDVETALQLGCDAVSVHINLGTETTTQQLRDMGEIASACARLGVPFAPMMYPRGKFIKDPSGLEEVSLCARVGAELGADIIKLPYTGDVKSFRQVVDGALGVPVVIAGGDAGDEKASLEKIAGAVEAGAAGVMLGRGAFQSEHPVEFIRAVVRVVHEGASVTEALKELA